MRPWKGFLLLLLKHICPLSQPTPHGLLRSFRRVSPPAPEWPLCHRQDFPLLGHHLHLSEILLHFPELPPYRFWKVFPLLGCPPPRFLHLLRSFLLCRLAFPCPPMTHHFVAVLHLWELFPRLPSSCLIQLPRIFLCSPLPLRPPNVPSVAGRHLTQEKQQFL